MNEFEDLQDSPLEMELRGFTPAEASARVREGLEKVFAGVGAGQLRREGERLSRADRVLLSIMSLGVAAAVTVVTLLAAEMMNARGATGGASSARGPAAAPMLEQTQEALAQLAAGNDPFVDREARERVAGGKP